MLVSIIVPVYNGEKYLDRCVSSLLLQKDAEIILVDDGSKDQSWAMCDDYEHNHANVHVIHQENAGDGAARNAGIEVSQGQYIMFVDADDYIPADTVEQLLETAQKQQAQIVIGTVNYEKENPSELITMTANEMLHFGIDQHKYIQQHQMPEFVQHINPGSQCMKLISRELFTKHQIRFHTNIRMHHQDTLFSMGLYKYCNKICIVNKRAYIYDTDIPGSMRKKMAENKKDEVYTLIQEMAAVIYSYHMLQTEQLELIRNFAAQMIYECWSEYYIHADNHRSINSRRADLAEFLDNSVIHEALSGIDQEVLESFPTYKRYVLGLMKHRYIMQLAWLACLWSSIKRKRSA